MSRQGWNRRDVLKLVSTAMLAAHARPAAAQMVKWSAGTEAPKLKAPANATDCHHHIYDAKYPVDPKATLRPADALVDDYRGFQKRIGTSRNVLVQPSTYGTDNRCHLDALAAFGPTARMVAVVNDQVSTEELKRMHALGVRGIRFNLAQAGATVLVHGRDEARLAELAKATGATALPDEFSTRPPMATARSSFRI